MKRIGLLALVLVFVLGSLGVAFAMWSEELTIDTTVNTGDLDVDFGLCDVIMEQEKAVGTYTCGPGAEPNTLEVAISNAYPCLRGDIMFDVVNVGTIPAHVIEVWFHFKAAGKWIVSDTEILPPDVPDVTLAGGATPQVFCDLIQLIPCKYYYFDLDNDCDADLMLHLKDGLICQQFDPPDMGLPGPDFVEGRINFHVEQGAEEEATYWFNIVIVACQWNEAP
jgi:hypothetical protein